MAGQDGRGRVGEERWQLLFSCPFYFLVDVVVDPNSINLNTATIYRRCLRINVMLRNMKKTLFLLLFLIIPHISRYAESQLYSATYDEPGFKMTLQEVRRTENTSFLKLDVLAPDAQGGFTIFKAACVIGDDLEKSHFTVISWEPLIKLFFTSNVTDDPMEIFSNEMSQEVQAKFNKSGYFQLKTMCKVFLPQ